MYDAEKCDQTKTNFKLLTAMWPMYSLLAFLP